MSTMTELLQQAMALLQSGRAGEALDVYERVLAARPRDAGTLNFAGIAAFQAGRQQQALDYLARAARAAPNDPEICANYGLVLHQSGRAKDAVKAYRRSLRRAPDMPSTYFNLGLALRDLGQLSQAVSAWDKALRLEPQNPNLINSRASALEEMGRLDEAEAGFRRAVALDPGYARAWANLAELLAGTGRGGEADGIATRLLAQRIDDPGVLYTLGNIAMDSGRLEEAATRFARALALAPEFAAARINEGSVLRRLGRLEEAARTLEEAVRLEPEAVEAHLNLGNVRKFAGDLEAAGRCFADAVALDPENRPAMAALLYVHMAVCDWAALKDLKARLDTAVAGALRRGERAQEPPYLNIHHCDDPLRNLAVAQSEAAGISSQRPPTGPTPPRAASTARLTIGYVSSDLRNHAIGHLISSLFGLHDRARFRVIAYSNSPDDGSVYRARTERDSDAFREVFALGDDALARQIVEDGVDILVDVNGFTDGHRLGVFAMRPAPVQVTWLGFPGATGGAFMDYMIADRTVVRDGEDAFYTERIVRLPHCYQMKEREPIAEIDAGGRAAYGLPPKGPVFCCFNRAMKLEPVMFEAWMRILRAEADSVLWLLAEEPAAENSLRAAAEQAGVAPSRLIFAEQRPKAEHLARYRLADLALDTRIYNGHTTTSDALLAGCPVVALEGRHFASRVSASILRAAGLEELIAADLDAYVGLARDFVSDRILRDRIVARVRQAAEGSAMFDAPRFVGGLERAFEKMWQRHAAEMPTAAIDVDDDARSDD
jgi:protein O-GlcNAc transferase